MSSAAGKFADDRPVIGPEGNEFGRQDQGANWGAKLAKRTFPSGTFPKCKHGRTKSMGGACPTGVALKVTSVGGNVREHSLGRRQFKNRPASAQPAMCPSCHQVKNLCRQKEKEKENSARRL